MRHLLCLGLLVAGTAFSTAPALAAGPDFTLMIKEHRFEPSEITVPAGQKIKLIVQNKDATPEEFESKTLKREKVIAGNSSATIMIGPLTPGRYPFYGEYNEKTAQGVVIVK